MYLKEDDITDINRIDEYNDDYKRMYPDFKPFVTRETFADFLKRELESSSPLLCSILVHFFLFCNYCCCSKSYY